jgi:hypothetical protein
MRFFISELGLKMCFTCPHRFVGCVAVILSESNNINDLVAERDVYLLGKTQNLSSAMCASGIKTNDNWSRVEAKIVSTISNILPAVGGKNDKNSK